MLKEGPPRTENLFDLECLDNPFNSVDSAKEYKNNTSS